MKIKISHSFSGLAATLLLSALIFFKCSSASATGSFITNLSTIGGFQIASKDAVAAIYVDDHDYAGVVRAAGDLKNDIAKVCGHSSEIIHVENSTAPNVIVVGTIGRSKLIDRLIMEHKLDASKIMGGWECYIRAVVENPAPGISRALVICGSDKRGTIYGIYDLSGGMGVSPWHFFEDVPTKHLDAIYASTNLFVSGPPVVKYRGIFINDEAPDLTEWVKERYGDYNHSFYTNVFELLLRLKANYLWPAMWNNCFNQDDPLNPQIADEYGIVMGTSHVEPMMRADKEWNRAGFTQSQWNYEKSPTELSKFWREGIERNKAYENLTTIAMRGKIDTPMSESANIALLEKIVTEQRRLIGDVFHTNAGSVPQLWALYKEVQEYHEKGMRVPDDVTLLWCDDNWGNLRRLPSEQDRQRSGGAGVYYHFDYVGGPRNYKWVDTSPLPKIWEQMNLANHYGANQIWILNVGHLQHVALPTEFFLRMAWDPKAFDSSSPGRFTKEWVVQQFGAEFAETIADILIKFGKYNGRRKPELLEPSTFSLENYNEAENVAKDWSIISHFAYGVSQGLSSEYKEAFFEMVLYPVTACANLNELYFTVAKNRLYAMQGRARTASLAERADSLFNEDKRLSTYYNKTNAGGRWNHMMDQTHIGYTYWQQPDTNVMPTVIRSVGTKDSGLGIAVEGSTNHWIVKTGPGDDSTAQIIRLPTFDKFNRPTRFLELYAMGKHAESFFITTSVPWILPKSSSGTVDMDERIQVSIDWDKVPSGISKEKITVKSADKPDAPAVDALVEVFNPDLPARDKLDGFVEADGLVSIEAEHFTRNIPGSSAKWEKIDDLGSTLSGMTTFPVTAASSAPPNDAACLEYRMYLFDPTHVNVVSILSPTLNFVAGRGLRFAVSFDDQPPQVITAVPENYKVGDGAPDWEKTVRDGVRRMETKFTLNGTGYHTLKFWRVDPGVVLQKLVVDLGGMKPSYLGPPESYHHEIK